MSLFSYSKLRSATAKSRETIGHMGWATAETFRAAPVLMGVYTLITLLEGFVPVFSLYVSKNLIDTTIHQSGRGTAALFAILPWVVAYFSGAVASVNLMVRLRFFLRDRLVQKLSYRIERIRLKLAAELPLLQIEDSELQNRIERSSNPGTKLGGLMYNLFVAFQSAVQMISLSFFFSVLSYWLPLLLILLQIPIFFMTSKGQKLFLDLSYRQTEGQRKAGYLDTLLTGRNEQKELRLFGLKPYLVERWAKQRDELRKEALALRTKSVLLEYPGAALNLVTATAILLYAATLLPDHRLSAGLYVALYQGVGRFRGACSSFAIHYREMIKAAGEVGFVKDFLQQGHRPMQDGCKDGNPRYNFPVPLQEGIAFDRVTFGYPGREPLLRGISFRLKPGEHVALVGENGAGKSTMVKLLLGLYAPDEGAVLADRLSYAEIEPASLRDQVSAAFQDFTNLAFTVSQSIALGNPRLFGEDGWTPNMAVVKHAAALGGADEVVGRLPGGWEQRVGNILDGSVDLSGGQWQRLALSRALTRDSQVLILDEPTAALDPKAEADLYTRFMQLMHGRTVLVISHRLGSARMADRILVVKNGQIVEEGHHNKLLQADGEYSRMWKEQAQWYQ